MPVQVGHGLLWIINDHYISDNCWKVPYSRYTAACPERKFNFPYCAVRYSKPSSALRYQI